ncbi:thioredoxin-like protein [Ilyonectria sp. MPI-CAGE-AT-0026]|nr:thioredoxin-like protein [Ilyonectria sp. MPI-CAGE-AT-0026]
MTAFNIIITADTVCPFCYVATKQISNAIAAYTAKNPASGNEFNIQWNPFFLIADPPKPSMDKREYFLKKYGAERMGYIDNAQDALGKEHGIKFAKTGTIGDTLDSHRLILFAGTRSGALQQKVISGVYKSYFEDGLDITSSKTLLKIATNAGLPEDETAAWLASTAGVSEVNTKVVEARASGITSTPHITVSGHNIGTQRDVQSFLDVFQKVENSSG